MILQVTETVNRTLVIDTPCHYLFGDCYLKILEDKALFISKSSAYNRAKIEVLIPQYADSTYVLFIEKGKEVSADEFNQAFIDVQNELTAIHLNQTLKVA